MKLRLTDIAYSAPTGLIAAAARIADTETDIVEATRRLKIQFPYYLIGHGGHHVYAHPASGRPAYLRIIES